ncbi:carboxymuconolactone decarboxylase family protein [Paenibacillus sp. UNC451MF]|uniref:carboxymuconolactone decarboxylase family protein n=1 Tax=Paenibacillus sp. UNC451MF TaxID=1449063 RepID=UPI00048C58C0|nr:carboxymuconolactone decarboxylase family protein [Paenibacillus sp. UNC451MF]
MASFDVLKYYEEVYGKVPEWVDMLYHFSPKAMEHYTLLRNEILVDGALPRKEKELILVGVNAARRYERSMIYHTQGAVDAGANLEEIADVVAACIISRGIPAWFTGMKAIQFAAEYLGIEGTEVKEYNGELPSITSLEDAYAYYEKESGLTPSWAQLLEKANPSAMVGYTNLRNVVLRDHVVSRKLKELVLIGVNLAERYPEGVQVHVNGAKKWGATDAEIAEVSLVCVLTAGIPSWFEISEFLQKA